MPVAGAALRSLPRELDDRRRQRGREEQRLPLRRQMFQHSANVRQESHVEHAIRFVEHEDLQPIESRVSILKVIEQTSRRRHQHVHSGTERVFLRTHADPAVDRGAGDRRVHGQIAKMLVDLRGQLARGREDERARGAALLADQSMEDRQHERCGLSTARHRRCQNILPCQRRRDGIGLNRRGSCETQFFDPAHEIGVKSE